MFYGRDSELKKLNEMHVSGKFEFAVIYGRRRIGKTTLIKEFCKDKKAVYFIARETGKEGNLRSFSNDVYYALQEEMSGTSYFEDWEKAFEYIDRVSRNERMILAIDEYPYLANTYKSISSILQAWIDQKWKDGKLFLILCGSSMSFMENQVLGYKSPLYGRRTAQFRVMPFSYFDSLPFIKGFDKVSQAVLYGATGGVPEYLSRIDNGISVRENIIRLFLTTTGHFYEEPSNLIKQELREPSTYNGIIEAIARGASKLNEIATKNHMESNKCAKYLTSLISIGIVGKEIPVTENFSKKSLYFIEDQMFRFWYRFVFPNMSGIEAGFGESVYVYDVEPNLNTYMGLVFERICKQYLFELMKREGLPFFIGPVGRWWGNNPKRKRQEEIDILTFRDDHALFCECKWTNEKVDIDVWNDLKERGDLFHYDDKHFYLFAKTGFTDRMVKEAGNRENVRLIKYEDFLF